MTNIKSYTDVEQSEKLAGILPIESADMRYKEFTSSLDYSSKHCVIPSIGHPFSKDAPCWSLAALHGILNENKICHYNDRYYCQYIREGDEFPIYSTAVYDNPVDACYEIILKLHELNLL